jgi:hypothetical protein
LRRYLAVFVVTAYIRSCLRALALSAILLGWIRRLVA